jgi:oxalate decarboxylase
MSVFDATSKARTFNYRAGDVGYVPKTLAHYIENIGNTKVRLLNVFNKPEFKDVALNQWLALTPPDLVRGHLDFNNTVMAALNPNERSVVR